jgi:hypothetical protein
MRETRLQVDSAGAPVTRREKDARKFAILQHKLVVDFVAGARMALKANPAVCIGRLINNAHPTAKYLVIRRLDGKGTVVHTPQSLVAWKKQIS